MANNHGTSHAMGGGDPIGDVLSGTGFAPTVSAETNCSGTTMTALKYSRVGNTVTMSGRFTTTATLTATPTNFSFDLPIASDLAAVTDLSGVAFCGLIAGMGAEVVGDATNNVAIIKWVASDITSKAWSFVAHYDIK